MKKFFIDNDIDEIITRTQDILNKFANKHIVLTGGRGFLGRYLTEIFSKLICLDASDLMNLKFL